jgi:hypothetical protein
MSRRFKQILFALFLIGSVAIYSCDDPIEELEDAGCAPNLPGWPGCAPENPGDDQVPAFKHR